MGEPRPSNVLPFGPPGAPPLAAALDPEAARLLALCRDRLAHGIATAFAGNLGKAHDDLLGMADRATSLEHQQLYFAATEILASRGQELLRAFRSAYVTQFDASLALLHRDRRLAHPAELGELSLIATDDFERDLAIDKLSARAACNCADQLTALERRIAALLRLTRVGQDDNPLYPRALFKAMLAALGELGVTDHLALTLLQEFERQTSVELPGIYNELNRELVAGGVLPRIPLGLARPAQRSEVAGLGLGREPRHPGEPGAQTTATWTPSDVQAQIAEPGGAYAPAGGGPERPVSGEDVFALLARAIQVNLGASPGLAATADLGSERGADLGPTPWIEYPPGLPAAPLPPSPVACGIEGATGLPAPGALLGVAQLIQALTSLQQGRVAARDLPGLGSVQIDPRSGQALRQLRATPLASWSHPLDALTIDVVARLFDVIFQEPDLSAALRAEIAKLQIPVLKVALMDKTFFSNARDPARRLLDGIASAGIGRDPADEDRVTDKVRTIVDEVVTGFDTDRGVFERQVQALEEFLQEEELRALSRASPTVVELEEQDRQARARARVDAEIAGRIQGRGVPALVADFLQRHWRLVLARAYGQAGEEGEPWQSAIATMDDLLWSIEPKVGPEDRARLLGTLPALLKRLRSALEPLDIGDAWDPFFAQLIRLHVAALHNEIPHSEHPHGEARYHQTQAPSPTPSGPPGSDGARSEGHGPEGPFSPVHVSPRDYRTLAQVDAEAVQASRSPVPSPSSTAQPSEAEDPHLRLAQSLAVGAWVELESDRGTRKTLRLSWVSELRGVYLFTNRQGENALTLSTASLAQHLRKGTARVLSQDQLTERAVAQLLGNNAAE
ncbi:MAG: DUF1631 domain-containing protein [Bdellovibrio bacteriovorus]